MNINFNITCNIYFQDADLSKGIEKQTQPIQEETSLTAFTRKWYPYTDAQLKMIQNEVDKLIQGGNRYTPNVLVAKAIMNTKVPTTVDSVFDKIKLPEGYLSHRFRRSYRPDEERIDRYILFRLGVPHSILNTIFGSAAHTYNHYNFDESDIIRIKEKYKDALLLYGIYDKIKLVHRPVPDHQVVTPDELSKVIDAYESLQPSNPASLIADVRRAAESCNINCNTEALKNLIFYHNIDGYKHIRVPQIKSMQKCVPFSAYTEEEMKMAQEVVFLHEYKHLGVMRISKLTGYIRTLVRRVFNMHEYNPISISDEMLNIFKQRYADLHGKRRGKRRTRG